MIKQLAKDSAKYLPSKLVPPLTGIIAIPILTRLFPPQIYGNYILVVAAVSFLSTIAVEWLSSSTIRFFPIYKLNNNLNQFYHVLLKLIIFSVGIITIFMVVILALLKNHISTNLIFLLRIGMLLFIVDSFWSVFLNLLRIKQKVGWYSIYSVWKSVAGLTIGIVIVQVFNMGIEGLLFGEIIVTIIIIPLLWKTSLGVQPFKNKGNIFSSMGKEIAKYGIPAMWINVLTWAQSLSDRYLLEIFRGSYEVGIYSASYSLAEKSIFFIVSLFHLAGTPIAFTLWENHGIEKTRDFMNKIARYYLLISVPAAVGISILAKSAIQILVESQYYAGYVIVPLVTFGAFLVGVAHRFAIIFSYYKRTDVLMLCYLGSVILNVALNILFIPKYGYIAAAATTFASYAFLLLSALFISRRFFTWQFPFKSLIKITCASAIMGIVVYLVSNSLMISKLLNLSLSICLGGFIYLVLLFLFREFQQQEKVIMKQVLLKYFPYRVIPVNR